MTTNGLQISECQAKLSQILALNHSVICKKYLNGRAPIPMRVAIALYFCAAQQNTGPLATYFELESGMYPQLSRNFLKSSCKIYFHFTFLCRLEKRFLLLPVDVFNKVLFHKLLVLFFCTGKHFYNKVRTILFMKLRR